MIKIIELYKKFRKNGSIVAVVLVKHLCYRLRKKNIVAHHKVSIDGVKNITTNGELRIGISYVGYMHKSDKTYLNIQGKAIFEGEYAIGRGCRIYVRENAVLRIGKGGYINANALINIVHGLTIGSGCVISWNVQFLDEDYHRLEYEGRQVKDKKIVVGDHVWIGCHTYIYKGSVIPDGCVVAANSVVRGVFTEKNAIIGGSPAKVIKSGVKWS